MPPRLAPYGASPAYPNTLVTEPILMIRPYPYGTMRRAICCATKKLPRRFVSTTRFQSSHVTSSAGLRTLPPALFTRICPCPQAASASAAIRSMLPWSRTSSSSATAVCPINSISAANGTTSSRLRLVRIRSAPAFANARAKCCPSPRLAPVTSATCPVRSNSLVFILTGAHSPLHSLLDQAQSSSS